MSNEEPVNGDNPDAYFSDPRHEPGKAHGSHAANVAKQPLPLEPKPLAPDELRRREAMAAAYHATRR